ncbi:MAG: ABC transporter ATP-binding protein [Prevotella sp.]
MRIDINQLQKKFGEKVAVDISDFTIHSGDLLGLVGNNGAGKTTLFRLLLDLLKADEGHILFTFDKDEKMINNELPLENSRQGGIAITMEPSQTEKWKEYTGAYLDDGFLIDFLTPEEYFQFVAKVTNIDKEKLNQYLSTLTKFMNDEILDQKKLIRDFSAGNKQKIGIISAMISQPDLLILDEPFNFLDPSSQSFLKKILLDYHESTGATILVSSHNLQHTVDISNRVVLLENGIIIKDLKNEQGSAEKELEDYFNLRLDD